MTHLNEAQSRKPHQEKPAKRNAMLPIASALLVAFGVVSVVIPLLVVVGFDFYVTSGELVQGLSQDELSAYWFIVASSAVLSFVGGVTSIVTGILGLGVRKAGNRRRRIEVCQVLAISLVGISVISVIASGISGGFNVSLVLDFAMSAITPVLFYVAVRREVRTTFWDGIKGELDPDAHDHAPTAPVEFDEIVFALGGEGAVPLAGATGAGATGPRVRLVPLSTFASEHLDVLDRAMPAGFVQHSYAVVGEKRCFGTLAIPENDGASASKAPMTCVFLLEDGKLDIAGADAGLVRLFEEFVNDAEPSEMGSAAGALAQFLAFVIRDDALFLHDQEHRLDRLEDSMTDSANEIPADFDAFVTHTRRLLRSLHGFYRQLSDMARSLEGAAAVEGQPADRRAFRMLADQAQRLADDSQELCDYTLHIRDFYQAKIDVRQNKVMQTLTIVTSIFMPLTLITGWYGMNFEIMPELHWGASYFVVIALAITLVTIEVVIFKRKKWF